MDVSLIYKYKIYIALNIYHIETVLLGATVFERQQKTWKTA